MTAATSTLRASSLPTRRAPTPDRAAFSGTSTRLCNTASAFQSVSAVADQQQAPRFVDCHMRLRRFHQVDKAVKQVSHVVAGREARFGMARPMAGWSVAAARRRTACRHCV